MLLERQYTPAQAAYVGRQVAQGLQYAHARGLVHRDIKSSNLLFDEHAIARVADFGLARALAEASWTEPSGTLVGTARYAAPEQASGAPLDGRADLYSLAVVLVEAVTGTVPNLGETPIATLAARTSKALVVPPELGRLGAVLERAGKPKPEERYPDAATMVAALSDVGRQLPPPQPLNLPGLGDGLEDPEPTRVGIAVPKGGEGPGDVTVTDDAVPLEVFDFEPASPASRPRRTFVPGTNRLVPWIAGGAIVLALVIGIAVLAGTGGFGGGGAGSVSVPSLVGFSQQDAAARATDAGVLMHVVRRTSDDPATVVISQDPAPGAFAHDGDRVTVVVSRGPPKVALPKVAGVPALEAQLALANKGFVVTTAEVYNDTIAAGNVVSTDPAGVTKAPRESTIKLLISKGPTPVPVPDVAGGTCDSATQALTQAGFKATCDQVFSETVAAGKVVNTDPPANTALQRDTAVAVHVSKGPERIQVPNVVGMPLEAASQRLESAGFQVAVPNYRPGGKVKAMAPAAGNLAKRGDTVTLYL